MSSFEEVEDSRRPDEVDEYIEKPVEVRAIRLTEENIESVARWVRAEITITYTGRQRCIEWDHGRHIALPGWWVVQIRDCVYTGVTNEKFHKQYIKKGD